MPPWELLRYRPDDGSDPIDDWVGGLAPEVRLAIEYVLRLLAATEDWADEVSYFRPLVRRLAGLHEVVIEWTEHVDRRPKKRQFRIASIWRPELHDCILLVGWEKSGRVPKPPTAWDDALKYKKQFAQRRGRLDKYQF